ncbi:MAG: NAD(P)-dependent alcohol dehydrogenase [Planctomycetaceae bacterium]|jgi:aryl-alcohol dehydrogenase|nr:NAD(P)-dependent alcohol dehydrogenase [Planctomycetaceae bacterium]
MKITAAVTHHKGEIAIETIDIAQPKASEVLVRVVAVGICHTDIAGINQLIPVTLPAVFGHEGVGVVEEVGVSVESLKQGDRVIMTYPSCGVCEYCLKGQPYACEHINQLFFDGSFKDGTKRFSQNGIPISSFFGQGSFATHVIVDTRNAVKVDVRSDDDLTKLCSLGCGAQTGTGAVFNRAKPNPYSSIAVFGCGGVGMAAIMAAKIVGCSKIIAIDIIPTRLEMAINVGATHTVNSQQVDAVEEIKKITNGGANYSIESSGSPMVTIQALKCLRREGLCVVNSVTGNAEVPIALEPLLMNPSVTLTGLTEGASNPQVFIPKLVQLFNEQRLPVDKLVKIYDFNNIKQALQDSHNGITIKPILKFH